jgi:uncharacterized protein (TIGR02246 family)
MVTKLSQVNANLPNRSLTMSAPELKLVDPSIKQLVERQANAWETADIDKVLADFAEDSLFVVPGSTFRGKQQIKASAHDYFAEFTDTKVTIKRIISNGNQVAVEWTWSDKNKKNGKTSKAEDAIIFELEGEKIKFWREYIDKQPQEN